MVKQTWLNWYRWVSDLVTGRNFGSLVQQKPHTLFVTTAHRPQQGCVLILIIQHTLKHTLRYDCTLPSAMCVLILIIQHTLKHTLHYDCTLPSARLCPHPDYTTGTTCVKTHCFLWLDWILPSHVLITGITNMHENALSLMARLNIPPAHPDNTTGTTNMC